MDAMWSDYCRSCLSADSVISFLDSQQNVSKKFFEVTTIQVKADDGLPQKICSNCYELLDTAYKFRKQCLKIDRDMKFQLNALITQSNNEEDNKNIQDVDMDYCTTNSDFANDPIKQLESIIKHEPVDSDDDCYYVLVIDNPKDEEDDKKHAKLKTNSQIKPLDFIKKEPEETPTPTLINNEKKINKVQSTNFDQSIDSFLVSETKVPVNVPSMILENEENSHDNEEFQNVMNIDESQDSATQQLTLAPIQEEILNHSSSDSIALNDPNNFVKILTSASDNGTIIIKSSDGLQYLPETRLVTNEENEDGLCQEVILCERDESSDFQIVKYDGSQLVIEYADDSEIATVLQQDDGTFLCDCGDSFKDISDYEKHQHIHNPAGEHLCNMCGKGFETPEILAGHMLLHSVRGSLITCPFCNQVLKRNTLTQHIKYNHNDTKPACHICFKTFANPNNLKRHLAIHSGIREFECDVCFKRFHQKITMQTHRLTHGNVLSCNLCDLKCDSQQALQAHKESDECSKSKFFKVKEELLKTVKQEVVTSTGKLLGYACSLCKKMFSVEEAFEQHVECVHIVDPSDLICMHCNQVLPSKKDMQIHLATHKNSKLKRFECLICGKGCSSQAMLVMHERVHTNERPFPCQLCSQSFKTKTHLRTHQLTHTREKRFGCATCLKFFALKGNLVVHLRTHTGERPYICSLCGEGFIDSKYLKKHKFNKHAIDNVPWNQY